MAVCYRPPHRISRPVISRAVRRPLRPSCPPSPSPPTNDPAVHMGDGRWTRAGRRGGYARITGRQSVSAPVASASNFGWQRSVVQRLHGHHGGCARKTAFLRPQLLLCCFSSHQSPSSPVPRPCPALCAQPPSLLILPSCLSLPRHCSFHFESAPRQSSFLPSPPPPPPPLPSLGAARGNTLSASTWDLTCHEASDFSTLPPAHPR